MKILSLALPRLLSENLPGILIEHLPNYKGTFVQGESRSQVYLDYAEPQPKVHLYERNSSKYRVDAKRMYREYTR